MKILNRNIVSELISQKTFRVAKYFWKIHCIELMFNLLCYNLEKWSLLLNAIIIEPSGTDPNILPPTCNFILYHNKGLIKAIAILFEETVRIYTKFIFSHLLIWCINELCQEIKGQLVKWENVNLAEFNEMEDEWKHIDKKKQKLKKTLSFFRFVGNVGKIRILCING